MLSAANIVPLRVAHTMKVPKDNCAQPQLFLSRTDQKNHGQLEQTKDCKNMLLTGLHAEKWRAGGCLEIKLSKSGRLR